LSYKCFILHFKRFRVDLLGKIHGKAQNNTLFTGSNALYLYICGIICIIAHMTTKELGEQIKERRNILRLQQKDLAELADVGLRTIIQIENGSGNPALNTISKLAKVLGMEIQLNIQNK
jgi:DNA-binding XRE family transcriptional regulator